ncbi:MAG TPA: S8 family serine peptidase [Solirubrobacterales bacterium]|nr:S8 family serine peptidase [Solirubrobacterales bacterium]
MQALVAEAGGNPAQADSARYAYLRELDGNLQALAAEESLPATPLGKLSGPAVTPAGKTLVDVYVDGDMGSASQQLRSVGMEVEAVSHTQPERLVEGYLPVDALTEAAALGATTALVAAAPGGTDSGSVLSQGDAAQRGPQARALGVSGSGVKVGVISDSINQVGGGIATSQASGDLPSHVTDLNDDAGGEDEGRAMAEIIYDEAPGLSEIIFDTGSTGAAAKAAHISELVNHGVKVIADDIFYLTEPFFQDGAVSQAVDAAKASGVAYLASAGNRARQSWEGIFSPGAGGANDFGGGDIRQAVANVPAHDELTITLQWNEPWNADTDKFNFVFYANNSLVGSCTAPTNAIPMQSCTFTAGSSSVQAEIEIIRVSGTGAPLLKYIASGNFGAFNILEHNTASNAINPDAAAAKGSLAVAAVCWSTILANCRASGPVGLTTPELFSSRGPVSRTRDASGALLPEPEVRAKPNLAGADGVSTSVPGFQPFYGTSAATPSIAGVAALALSASPQMTVGQLYGLLTDPANALDCTSAPGDPDSDCGVGFIQADRVVAEAQAQPSIVPTLTPAAPDGAHGWYRGAVDVAWEVTPGPPISNEAGCAPTVVASDGTSTFSCEASAPGGTGKGSVTIKRDASPPAAPAIGGITAQTYPAPSVPRSSAVGCTASDPTSGIDSCVVTGYSAAVGTHTLTATATNGAGAQSTSGLTYKVVDVCTVPKLKGKSPAAAGKALTKAHCKLGKTKPKHPSGRLVVKSSSPTKGAVLPAGSPVKLRFAKKKH